MAHHSQYEFDDTNCNAGSLKRSPSDKDIFSLNINELHEILQASTPSKNEELQLDNTTVNVYSGRENNSNDSNYGYISDTFKAKLHDSENLIDSETIDFLQNSNTSTVINLYNTKVSPDISIGDANDFQEMDDTRLEPAEDPLFISDSEKNNIDTIYNNSKFKCSQRKLLRLQSKVNNVDEERSESDTEEEEKEELPLNILEKLLKLHIKIIHKIPPQHKIELNACHAPSQKVKKLFERYGPLRKGPYSPEEDKIIIQNWKTFCKLHKWDSKHFEAFCIWIRNGKYYIRDINERQKFYQFLANGLHWRTLNSVYCRFKILHYNKISPTRYTPKEDKKILTYIQNDHLDNSKTKYKELSKVLKRTRRSIAKRYKYLKHIYNKLDEESEVLVKVKWTLPLIKKFIKTLLNLTLSDNIKELKDAILPEPVWQKMEKKLNIDKNVLRLFWYHQLHLQLFCKDPIYLNDIKIQLIEYMHQKGISHNREIIWSNVAQCFEGVTSVFLCQTFHHILRDCNMNTANNFEDVVAYLYHTVIPKIKNNPMDKFLPKIIYENREVHINAQHDNDVITTNTTDCKND